MMNEKLHCFFLGSRDYIQGSQILVKAAEAIKLRSPTTEVLTLCSAKFTQITSSGVHISTQELSHGVKIGEAEFELDGVATNYLFYSTDESINDRVEDSQKFYDALSDVDGLNGRASYAHLESSLSNMLCAVVAANKEMHSRLGETVHDVWFTGLRNASIGTMDGDFPSRGFLLFKHMFTAGSGTHQTLSRVTILDADENPVVDPFIINFAYKS